MNAPEAFAARQLSAYLSAGNIVPSTSVSWPRRAFTPPEQGNYLRVSFLPVGTEDPFVADNASRFTRGLMQVDVFAPDDDQGLPPVLDVAGQVRARFARGTKFSGGGYELRLERTPTLAAPVENEGWTQVPVTIPWTVYE